LPFGRFIVVAPKMLHKYKKYHDILRGTGKYYMTRAAAVANKGILSVWNP